MSGSVVNVIVSVVNLICAYDETYFNCTPETHRNKSFSNISFFYWKCVIRIDEFTLNVLVT